MPLRLYRRGSTWWFKGRIDEVPGGEYYRQSTRTSDEAAARREAAAFENRILKGHYAGEAPALTFAEAVLLYDASPAMARDLIRLLDHLGDFACRDITAQQIRNLGPALVPHGSTDYWRRHIVTPARAVINNAHDLGHCPPIRVPGYTKQERLRQDRKRGKPSRAEKTPGSWPWLRAFQAHASPYLAALAQFMFETGARIGQATALEPGDLDLQNNRVWMPEAKGVEAQWVTLSVELTVMLANLRPHRPRKGPHGRTRPSLRVFGYARKDGVYGAWKTACRRAGIETILPHAAGRHGFATELLVRQGLDAPTVARAGRWSDVPNLMKTYAHAEDATARVQAAMNKGREAGGQRWKKTR